MIAEQEGVMSGAMYGIKIYWINSSPQEFRYTPYLYENRTFTKKCICTRFLRTRLIRDI